jgi:hypothetical protein
MLYAADSKRIASDSFAKPTAMAFATAVGFSCGEDRLVRDLLCATIALYTLAVAPIRKSGFVKD